MGWFWLRKWMVRKRNEQQWQRVGRWLNRKWRNCECHASPPSANKCRNWKLFDLPSRCTSKKLGRTYCRNFSHPKARDYGSIKRKLFGPCKFSFCRNSRIYFTGKLTFSVNASSSAHCTELQFTNLRYSVALNFNSKYNESFIQQPVSLNAKL